jgi:glycosyltransferase involved in cell wall biosynthesis
MSSAAIIVPTTGAPEARVAIASVLAQTHAEVRLWVVVDGPECVVPFQTATAGLDLRLARVSVLPENVGRGGYYGHRVYAGFSHLVNADYLLFLDEDNWFEPDHVASMIDTIEERDLEWCFALRRICGRDGTFLINDDCESLGKCNGWTNLRFVDTSAYCVRLSIAAGIASVWHGGYGQDRVFFSALSKHFPRFDCSGRYTVNYRLAGNPGSVTREFFDEGNAAMRQRYPNGFPWTGIRDSGPEN